MGFSGQLAWRFFRGSKKQGLVSLISAISIAGMTLAIALLIVVLSVMNGFEQEFRERILGVVPHARLQFGEPRDDWRQLREQFLLDQSITQAIPYIEFQALAVSKGNATPIGVQGIGEASDLKTLHDFVQWHDKAGQGTADMPGLLKLNEIIIGSGLAARTDLTTGDKLRLLRVESAGKSSDNKTEGVDASNSSIGNSAKRTSIYSATIVGILKTGTQLDNQIGLVSLDFASQIKGLDDRVEGMQFQVVDVFEARSIIYEAASTANVYGYLSDWKGDYGNLYSAIQLSRQLVVMLVATIVAVAVFNVFVTLGMVVRYKRKEISILKTLGLTRSRVLNLFFWQGVIIALPGCILGSVIGVATAMVLPELVLFIQDMKGEEFLSTEIYPISYLPTTVRVLDIGTINGMALLMSFVATLIPAYQAAKLQPATVLSHRS